MLRSALGDLVSFVYLVLMDMRTARAGSVHFGSTMTAEEQEIESSLHAVRSTCSPQRPAALSPCPAMLTSRPRCQVAMILLALLGLAHGATRLRIPLVAKPCGAALLAGLLFAGRMAEG
eukprot:scaffold11351_cov141-Isochrysis_galbana.AAC.1